MQKSRQAPRACREGELKKKGKRMPLRDFGEILLFIGIWLLLQKVILPKMGVGT
jgi:hypothetical protein